MMFYPHHSCIYSPYILNVLRRCRTSGIVPLACFSVEWGERENFVKRRFGVGAYVYIRRIISQRPSGSERGEGKELRGERDIWRVRNGNFP